VDADAIAALKEKARNEGLNNIQGITGSGEETVLCNAMLRYHFLRQCAS
jgi:hypothetical protein